MTLRTDFEVPDDGRFCRAEYVVVATDCERVDLHWQWTHLGGVRIESDGGSPYTRAIGRSGDAAIVVSVRWSLVGGHLVAFVDGYSQVVDYGMISAWCRDVFPCLASADAQRYRTAAAFGDVVRELRDSDGLPVDTAEVARRVVEAVESSASLARRRITGTRASRVGEEARSGIVVCPACGSGKDVGAGPAMIACECLRAVYMDAALSDGEIVGNPAGGHWLTPASTAVFRVRLDDPGFRVVGEARGSTADWHGAPAGEFVVFLDQHVVVPGDSRGLGESKIVEVRVTRERLASWRDAIAGAVDGDAGSRDHDLN